jgi:hypothetical protein
MYYGEHGPPHVHARHGADKISVEIASGVIRGDFPLTARQMVLEWVALHRAELLENWELARRRQPLRRIAPLD